MKIIELATEAIIPIGPDESCKMALEMMENLDLRHLPVVAEGKYVGLVAHSDILNVDDAQKVVEVLHPSSREMTVYGSEHFFAAISLMYEKGLTLVPVIDHNNNYCGTISQERILFAFAESLSFTEPGGILVLKVNRRDYSLAEIAQIIESEHGLILTTFIHKSPDSKFVFVTVKINKNNLDAISRSFERHEYEIQAAYLEEEYEDVLKERYDELMNYLNI